MVIDPIGWRNLPEPVGRNFTLLRGKQGMEERLKSGIFDDLSYKLVQNAVVNSKGGNHEGDQADCVVFIHEI